MAARYPETLNVILIQLNANAQIEALSNKIQAFIFM